MHQKVSESTILPEMSVLIEWSCTDVTQYGCDLVICHEYDKYHCFPATQSNTIISQFYSRIFFFFSLINISLSVWRPNKGYHCKFSNFLSTLCFSPQCLEFVTLWQVKRKQWSTTRKEKLVLEREFSMFGKVLYKHDTCHKFSVQFN